MKSTLTLVVTLLLLSLISIRAQDNAVEKDNSDCLEMVLDEINKDLEFLIKNPEGNDSAIRHLTRLRNRILLKVDKPEHRPANREQDSILAANVNTAIQDQINELKKARERLLKSSSETNPVIINLDKQIEKLEQLKKKRKQQ